MGSHQQKQKNIIRCYKQINIQYDDATSKQLASRQEKRKQNICKITGLLLKMNEMY